MEYFPIPRLRAELTWGHYRLLCQVNDQGDRDALLDEAVKRHWNCADLESRVRAINAINVTPAAPATDGASPPARKPLVPNRGTPGLHQIVEKCLGPAVDLGFRHYWPLTPEQAKRFAKGDIVRIASDDSVRSVAGARKAELFTYAAQLVRVVDGDTLVVALEISPGEFLEQKLRLRGLDCPEMSTPEGKAAKRFVDALMTRTTALVINTTKPDKYDRYLADVFLIGDFSQLLAASGRSEDGSALDSHLSSEIYLNNFLLENGQAVRKDPEDFEDSWGFK